MRNTICWKLSREDLSVISFQISTIFLFKAKILSLTKLSQFVFMNATGVGKRKIPAIGSHDHTVDNYQHRLPKLLRFGLFLGSTL